MRRYGTLAASAAAMLVLGAITVRAETYDASSTSDDAGRATDPSESTAPRQSRKFPVPAATGFDSSPCQATTRTFAMRRPCFTIAARPRRSRGPAERR
jgi:hypothetical protein